MAGAVGASDVTRHLVAARAITAQGLVGPISIGTDAEGIIAEVVDAPGAVPQVELIAPGFVDIQVNGIGRVNVATATGDDWRHLDAALLAQGTTTWCPTVISTALANYPTILDRIATARADGRGGPGTAPPRPTIAGAHLEGPFLGGRPGAHSREHLAAIDPGFLAGLDPGLVRVVTLAPELDGARDAIAGLTARGIVVGLGHSAADATTTRVAIDAGAGLVTHLFNAMGPFHHRDPGLVGVALTDDRVTTSLIADGVHLDPIALSLAGRAKPADRRVLVTDAAATSPTPNRPHAAPDDAPRLADGTLAGSVLRLDAAVAAAVAAGWSLADAVAAASTVPAGLLGLGDRGVIAPGHRADLVALDPGTLAAQATWVAGRPAHPAN